MPELPEVETVMRGLAPVMAGARIVRVEQRRADLRFPLPERLPERLAGRCIEAMSRRAKYILVHLDGAEILTVHLGMTGRITMSGAVIGGNSLSHAAGGDRAHDHVILHLSNGAIITFNDARRFGYMDLVPLSGLATHKHFKHLGVEPMSDDLTPEYIAARAEGRRVDLKAFLMDQHIIAGLGNIYVCEALWRSGQKPVRQASTIRARNGQPNDRARALVVHIRAVLAEAIAAGGSSLRDYVQASGELGYFQKAHAVYDREHEPCLRTGCPGTVRRMVQAGRSTFHCPRCQR